MNGKLLALVLPLVMLVVGAPRRLSAQSTIPTNNAVQAQGTTLKDLVAELERGNPELGAARREIDMRVARIAPAGALPDPTVSDHRCCDPLHDVGAGPRAPHDGQQAQQDGHHRHHLEAKALDGAFLDGFLEIGEVRSNTNGRVAAATARC